MHRMVKDKDCELKLLDKEMKRAQGEEKSVARDFGSGNLEFEEAEIKLDLYKENHDFQRMNTRTYRYMLDRMSKDLIALTLEINDLTESLRSKKQIMEDEANKKILARENKLQSNYRYQKLMHNIAHEMTKNKERIHSLNVSIENKDQTL
jgi:hypothetical protein